MNQVELNDLYDYDMYIYQNSKYFKFSVDSVLLAEFVRVRKNAKNVLDLCSGNAPIPLILSKKFGDRIRIDAYELQPEIYELGKMSIRKNSVRNINYYNDDIKNVYKDIESIAGKRLLDMLPDELKEDYKPLFEKKEEDIELWKLVKAADKISALIKCIEEYRMGNREFEKALEAQQKKIEEIDLKEVEYFRKNFLNSYYLTLDEHTK